jgi:hypothetical protein
MRKLILAAAAASIVAFAAPASAQTVYGGAGYSAGSSYYDFDWALPTTPTPGESSRR